MSQKTFNLYEDYLFLTKREGAISKKKVNSVYNNSCRENGLGSKHAFMQIMLISAFAKNLQTKFCHVVTVKPGKILSWCWNFV